MTVWRRGNRDHGSGFIEVPLTDIARRIRVTGIVQGVGFRPFVWRLAQDLKLTGWVRNDAWGVEISAQGTAPKLAELLRRLKTDAPPLARVGGPLAAGQARGGGLMDADQLLAWHEAYLSSAAAYRAAVVSRLAADRTPEDPGAATS